MPEGREPVILWRAYVNKWAYLPLSGEGAARFGGRWNPEGVPAIYAARELSTAWAKYNQGFVQHPTLIAQLELSGARLADLTDTALLEQLGIGANIHDCEWRADREQGAVPATHAVYESLAALGFAVSSIPRSCPEAATASPSGTGMNRAEPRYASSIRMGGCRRRQDRGSRAKANWVGAPSSLAVSVWSLPNSS